MDFANLAKIGRACSVVASLWAIGLPAVLTACSDDSAPPPVFTPLSYSYLRPLRLNVGAIEIDPGIAVLPGGRDIAAQSPAVPADALRQMAQDRLVAAGAGGRAVFNVEQASIIQAGGTLDGLLKVRLDIYTSGGQRAAYAEAAVARSTSAPDSDNDQATSSALYTLTRQMMSDMNVELEFQLRRSLGDWLQAADGTAPPPAAVEQQALPPPGTLPPAAPASSNFVPAGSGYPGSVAPPAGTAPNPSGGFRFVPLAPPGPAPN